MHWSDLCIDRGREAHSGEGHLAGQMRCGPHSKPVCKSSQVDPARGATIYTRTLGYVRPPARPTCTRSLARYLTASLSFLG
jgi:hypothetical protein